MKGINKAVGLFDLALEIVDKITGGHTQSERVLILGEIGSGKSLIALVLAHGIACWMSVKTYGHPFNWREFFDPEKDMAVIDGQHALEIISNATKKHHVYVIDDAAVEALNSRGWFKKTNKRFDEILQSNRPFENVIIFTTQLGSFLDSQARPLFSTMIEASGPHSYDIGINFVKAFVTKLRVRAKDKDKVGYAFFRRIGFVWDLLACGEPPAELVKAYKKVRKEEAERIAERARKGEEEPKPPKEPTKAERIREFAGVHRPPKDKKRKKEYVDGLSDDLDCTPDHIRQVLHRYGY